jgi:Zn-dependent peptidase ImmA (M78 family)
MPGQYTLIHEYAHLLARRPGISDLNRRNPVEVWCNRFAAAFLMPIIALRQVLPNWPDRPQEWPDATIHAAARSLNVSAQALAIRLEDLGRAHEGLNRRFVYRALPPRKRAKVRYTMTLDGPRALGRIGFAEPPRTGCTTILIPVDASSSWTRDEGSEGYPGVCASEQL